MAGSYNDSSTSLLSQNAKAYDWCWRSLGTEIDLDSIASDYLSSGCGKVLGSKAGVIAYY